MKNYRKLRRRGKRIRIPRKLTIDEILDKWKYYIGSAGISELRQSLLAEIVKMIPKERKDWDEIPSDYDKGYNGCRSIVDANFQKFKGEQK